MFLLRSRYLYLYLISSFASEKSEISNGGVFDSARIVASVINTSISQVTRLGFACHSGRALTLPVNFTTYSERNLLASSQAHLLSSGSKTAWLIPYLSLRSMKIIPQWSRLFATHQDKVTVCQMLDLVNSQHV